MNKKQKIFYITIGVFIGILFSVGLAWFAAFQRWVGYSFPSSQYKNGEGVFNSGIPLPVHPSYPSDFSKNQNLIGGASNVFVARVSTQSGNKETSIGPRTQYIVEIIHNIKGNLSGTVTLDELGGYKDDQLVLIEDISPDDFFLVPGATYVFATRYNDKEGWYTVIGHPNGMKLLTKDTSLDTTALQTLIDQDLKVRSLEAAYPDEKLLDADIAHNNTRNSFQSLPPEAKAAAQARADAARISLDTNTKTQ
jgi:hypothetical protein